MKFLLKYFLAAAAAAILLPAAAQRVDKTTHCFAVRDGQQLCLDRYTLAEMPLQCDSAARELRPCVMFVFGGGFVGGSRDAKRYIPYFETLARCGWDVVSIDYRLGMREVRDPGVFEAVMAFRNTVAMAVEDLYAATGYLLDRADEWHIDPSKIVASGSSAGAITVLQAENGICNGIDAAAELLPEGFNYGGVISFAGAIFSMTGRPDWDKAPCPLLLFHGTSDRNVPYGRATLLGVGFYGSEVITSQLQQMHSPYYFYSADYADHSMAESPMTDNLPLIEGFIREYVIGGRNLSVVEKVCDEAHSSRPTEFSIFDYLNSNYGE